MMKEYAKKIVAYVAAILIALYALAIFRMAITTGLAHHGGGDFYIFLNHAHLFINQGMIYLRDLSLYGPGEPIYKFPPLYGSLLVEAIRAGTPEEGLYLHAWALQVIGFIGGILLCLHAKISENEPGNQPLTVACVFAFSFCNGFFIDNAYRLQLEPYIFFLASASFFMLTRNKPLGAGFFIAGAAMLKIYPAMLMLYALFSRCRWRIAAGSIAGGAAALLVSLWLLNLDEHVFYAFHILPRLLTEYIYDASENISIGHMLTPLFPSSNAPKTINSAVFIACLLWWLAVMVRRMLRSGNTHEKNTTAIDFATLFMIMLSGMANFWWNYQLLNLLPAIVAIRIVANQPLAHKLPLAALLLSFLLQNIVTGAPFFLPDLYTALIGLGDPTYIALRGSIQIALLVAVLLLQWQVHSNLEYHPQER